MTRFFYTKKPSIILILSVILLTFFIPVLLLLKIIRVEPNAPFAQTLLLISIPITIGSFLIQTIYFWWAKKRIRPIQNPQNKSDQLVKTYTIRMGISLVAIIPNLLFLALTNFDMFLVINILILLWMINIFPYSEKIKLDLTKLS